MRRTRKYREMVRRLNRMETGEYWFTGRDLGPSVKLAQQAAHRWAMAHRVRIRTATREVDGFFPGPVLMVFVVDVSHANP